MKISNAQWWLTLIVGILYIDLLIKLYFAMENKTHFINKYY